jgi:hypothetical protein
MKNKDIEAFLKARVKYSGIKVSKRALEVIDELPWCKCEDLGPSGTFPGYTWFEVYPVNEAGERKEDIEGFHIYCNFSF